MFQLRLEPREHGIFGRPSVKAEAIQAKLHPFTECLKMLLAKTLELKLLSQTDPLLSAVVNQICNSRQSRSTNEHESAALSHAIGMFADPSREWASGLDLWETSEVPALRSQCQHVEHPTVLLLRSGLGGAQESTCEGTQPITLSISNEHTSKLAATAGGTGLQGYYRGILKFTASSAYRSC